ncbi:FG-GAP repeat domain-containing protein, partial [Acidobacteriota bacterium]
MSIKRLFAFLIVFVLTLSVLSYSEDKNRVVIAEGDLIKLFEYDPAGKKFDMIWESAETGTAIKSPSFGINGMVLKDIDKDGKNELVAIDQFGIFIWGKNGKVPVYYNLRNGVARSSNSYVLPIDLDNDGVFEFVTQRKRGIRSMVRQIGAWKIQGAELAKVSEIELPGGTSWSLRIGDCDNDKSVDILTSGALIHVLGWEETTGFIEKARFPNNSNLVDVVRVADVDGNGTNEILASGNSGCFSIYSAREIWDSDKYDYPVVYQSTKLVEGAGHYTQGLDVADIDGDGKNEVLVGVTARRGEENDNIFVYDCDWGDTVRTRTNSMTLKKVFSMKLESSSIPGFTAGDLDNDGSDEIIYNNKYVLKFTRDSENQLQCTVLATLVERGSASLIGSFQPIGEDLTNAARIIPQNLFIDLKDNEIIESGQDYKIWVKVISPWKEAKNVLVRLESEMEKLKVLSGDFQIPVMEIGQTYDNRTAPFLISPEGITEGTYFSLRVEVSTEEGYQVLQSYTMGRSSDEANFFFSA